MNAKELANTLRNIADCREASWDSAAQRYNTDWYDAAKQCGCTEDWAEIIAVLLYPEYADVWSWCDKWAPIDRPGQC